MIYLLLWISLRHLARHPTRTALTLLGVVVGVTTFVVAVSVSLATAGGVHAAIDDIAGRADLEVRGPAQGFSRRVLAQVRGVPGVAAAAPLRGGSAVLDVGERDVLLVFGVDPRADQSVRTYELVAGVFLTRRTGGLLLPAAYIERRGLRLGQRITLAGASGPRTFTLVGALGPHGPARLSGGAVAVMSLEDAAGLRGSDHLDSIAIVAAPGVAPEQLAARLRGRLPAALTVDAPQSRGQQVEKLLGLITVNMTMSSLAVLGLGSTLIFNTMAVAAAQRRTEIGVLRALGVSRRAIRAIFLAESGALGLLGSLLGLALGSLLTEALRGVEIMPLPDTPGSTAGVGGVPPWVALAALVAGVAVPLLAGLLPSRAAARVPPVEALSPTRAEEGFVRLNRRRLVAGLTLMLAALIALPLISADAVAILVLVVWAPLIAAGMLVAPLLLLLGRFLPPLMARHFGAAGLLAADNLTKRPRRVAATGVVLLVSLALGVYVTGFRASFAGFVESWNRTENAWDLVISAAGDPARAFPIGGGLPEALPRWVAARPAAAALAAERRTSVQLDSDTFDLRAIDMAAFLEHAHFVWHAGDEQAAYAAVRDPDRRAILISNFVAYSQRLGPGDEVTVETPRGPAVFEVAGVTVDARTVGKGVVLIDRGLYRELWRDDQVDLVMVRLAPEADAEEEREALRRRFPDAPVAVSSAADASAAIRANLDPPLAAMQVFFGMIVATAVLGIANTLLIAVIERRREVGTLRAVGMLRGQVARSMLIEAALLATVAGIAAVPLGIYMNYAVMAVFRDFMGLQFRLDLPGIALTLALGVAAAALSASMPARHAARLDVLEALRCE